MEAICIDAIKRQRRASGEFQLQVRNTWFHMEPGCGIEVPILGGRRDPCGFSHVISGRATVHPKS